MAVVTIVMVVYVACAALFVIKLLIILILTPFRQVIIRGYVSLSNVYEWGESTDATFDSGICNM